MARRDPIRNQLRAVHKAIAEAEKALAKLSALVRETRKSAPQRTGRTLNLSPRRRAALKLQGAYMGFMRQLGPRQKTRVRGVKERSGIEAGIKLARKLAGKP